QALHGRRIARSFSSEVRRVPAIQNTRIIGCSIGQTRNGVTRAAETQRSGRQTPLKSFGLQPALWNHWVRFMSGLYIWSCLMSKASNRTSLLPELPTFPISIGAQNRTIAVPWDNVPGTLASLPKWNNQILIDGTNPFHGKAGDFKPADVGNLSTSQLVAALAPDERWF